MQGTANFVLYLNTSKLFFNINFQEQEESCSFISFSVRHDQTL